MSPIWCDLGRSAARFMSGLVTKLVLLAAQTVAAVFGRMTLESPRKQRSFDIELFMGFMHAETRLEAFVYTVDPFPEDTAATTKDAAFALQTLVT